MRRFVQLERLRFVGVRKRGVRCCWVGKTRSPPPHPNAHYTEGMRWILPLLFASAAFAQAILPSPGGNPPLLELKQFLELTDAQYAQIFQNINQYQRTMSSYQQRVFELQRDIAIETARENPSASELGTRYVEVEINCRLMNEEAAKLRTRNQALLTTAQKTKLQVLIDAIKLMPLVSQAQQASLLEPVSVLPVGIGSTGGSIGSFILPTPVPTGACYSGGIIRTPMPLTQP